MALLLDGEFVGDGGAILSATASFFRCRRSVHAGRSIEFSCIVACLRETGSRLQAGVSISKNRPHHLLHNDLTAWRSSIARVRFITRRVVKQGAEVNSVTWAIGSGGPAVG